MSEAGPTAGESRRQQPERERHRAGSWGPAKGSPAQYSAAGNGSPARRPTHRRTGRAGSDNCTCAWLCFRTPCGASQKCKFLGLTADPPSRRSKGKAPGICILPRSLNDSGSQESLGNTSWIRDSPPGVESAAGLRKCRPNRVFRGAFLWRGALSFTPASRSPTAPND